MVTIVQGAKSSCRDVRYGVPQGSVLGPILFSLLICNDLPHIIQDEEVDIEMFADDTTICAICQNPDIVANILNNILKKLSTGVSKIHWRHTWVRQSACYLDALNLMAPFRKSGVEVHP